MRRWSATCLLGLFTMAALAIPAIHLAGVRAPCVEAACADHPDEDAPPSHDAGQCPICHLAATPMLVAGPMPVAVAPAPRPTFVPVRSAHSPTRTAHILPFACGPPA